MEREIKFRNREELETYELDSLRMVGTLEDQSTQWGIIRDPQGTVHRVRVGNYLGRNIGKILNIYEDKIELREIIKNVDGRWEERQAAIALAGE
jgi:type IV pilus assembly protein PilP